MNFRKRQAKNNATQPKSPLTTIILTAQKQFFFPVETYSLSTYTLVHCINLHFIFYEARESGAESAKSGKEC
jgi:hypothetical protein